MTKRLQIQTKYKTSPKHTQQKKFQNFKNQTLSKYPPTPKNKKITRVVEEVLNMKFPPPHF